MIDFALLIPFYVLAPHQKREATAHRDRGDETLAEISRHYNVSGWTISRLSLD